MTRLAPNNKLFRANRRNSDVSRLTKEDTLEIFSVLQTAMIALYINPLPNEFAVRSAIKSAMNSNMSPKTRYFLNGDILGDRNATVKSVTFFNTVLQSLGRPLINIPVKVNG